MSGKTIVRVVDTGALEDLKARMAGHMPTLNVGVQGGESVDGVSLVLIAGVHEFGSPSVGIPERSFLRSTFDRELAKYEESVEAIGGAFVDGDITLEQGLELLGQIIEGDVRQTIEDGIAPSLKQSTVERKNAHLSKPENDTYGLNASTPLIDTGRLIGAIKAVVE